MSSEKLKRLWDILSDRGGFLPDMAGILEVAKKHNIPVTAEDVRTLAIRIGQASEKGVWPAAVFQFIVGYLSGRRVESILDPWAGLGTLLLPLVKKTGAKTATAVEPEADYLSVAKALDAENAVSWVQGNALEQLDTLEGPFDVIASCPPLGVPRKRVSFPADSGPIEIHDGLGHLTILKSCLRLSDDGVGMFLVSQGFVPASRQKGVPSNLPGFRLYIESYVAISSAVFRPVSSVPAALVIIRKGKARQVFVGELGENPDRNNVLLRNLKAQTEGKEVALGKLVETSLFTGYQPLVAQERIVRLADRMGLKGTCFGDLVIDIKDSKAPDFDKPGSFDERANAVYLPWIGLSNALTSLSELTLKPHNYAQLIIDDNKADARYVANFLNTPLGHAIRESAFSGVIIPKITKRSLANLPLFLPDRKTQTEILEADSTINNLVSELQELRGQLLSQPRQLARVLTELGKVNKEDRFTDWLDRLPFPLASILWAYHASNGNDRDQYEHLDHFFEALAQFMAVVLLSGFTNDPELFAAERAKISKTLSQNHLSLTTATFGTWVRIAERLSKRARTMLKGNRQERAQCEQLFRTSDHDVLEALVSSKLIGTLQQTNKLRNDWRGHGGVLGDRTAEKRRERLESYLTQVRECFGDAWNRYQLVQSRSMKLNTEGLYAINGERLMGVPYPFKSIKFQASMPLEDGQLYLLGEEERLALKLLPLVKVGPSPETAQNACYFYNREQDDRVKFVSYHFEDKPELVDAFEETAKAIRLILGEHEAGS